MQIAKIPLRIQVVKTPRNEEAEGGKYRYLVGAACHRWGNTDYVLSAVYGRNVVLQAKCCCRFGNGDNRYDVVVAKVQQKSDGCYEIVEMKRQSEMRVANNAVGRIDYSTASPVLESRWPIFMRDIHRVKAADGVRIWNPEISHTRKETYGYDISTQHCRRRELTTVEWHKMAAILVNELGAPVRKTDGKTQLDVARTIEQNEGGTFVVPINVQTEMFRAYGADEMKQMPSLEGAAVPQWNLAKLLNLLEAPSYITVF